MIKNMMKERAFTLIELLVAVAVLSILSAIAIPHAQNALVKSKIARAHADMETLHKAFMLKIMDENNMCEIYTVFCERYKYLTTPVAYLPSIEQAYDVFGKHTMDRNPENIQEYSRVPLEERKIRSLCYQYYWGVLLIAFLDESYSTEAQRPEIRVSVGPDEIHQGGLFFGVKAPFVFYNRSDVYQPSNGLISAGDLVVTSYELDRILTDIKME